MYRQLFILFTFLFISTLCTAQIDSLSSTPTSRDTIVNDSLKLLKADTTRQDSLKKDSLRISTNSTSFQDDIPSTYPLSKDAVEKEILFTAKDSNITNVELRQIILYDDATVQYEQMNIEADTIVVNFDQSIAKAYAHRLPNGTLVKRASFDDGSNKGTYYEFAYNFDTKKAFAKGLKTQEGEFSILGDKAKFIDQSNDTLYNEAKFFNKYATLSTCNLDHPHFGIKARKLKYVPDKYAVLGPSQMYIMDIPTPLVLPFGFLPLIKGQSSGLIFPRNYEYDDNYGFGLRGIGYYFPINDYYDLTVTGDIYTRGSHGINVSSNFKKRYAYSGNAQVSYYNFLQEGTDGAIQSRKTFKLNITRNQDPKAHPYRRIDGNINISGNQHDRVVNNDAQNVLNNTYRSNFKYTYNFPDSPFNLNVAFKHSQNTDTRQVDITLPEATLSMNTIQPFKRTDQIGGEKWYEKINLNYNAGLRNYVRTTDTTIFERETLDNLVTGFAHDANISYNGRFLKYFTVSPRVNYEEVYNLKTFERRFNDQLILDTMFVDTTESAFLVDTTFGQIEEGLVNRLNAFRSVDMGVSVNTQIFGTLLFPKSKIRGIRHVMKPSLSFNYTPDTKDRYEEVVRTDLRDEFNEFESYNPFPRNPFPVNLNPFGMNASLSINNALEAKYYSKKDSTVKKVKILENWRVATNYNFARDSMNWDNVTIRGQSRLFKGISNINVNLMLTPYELENGTRELNSYLLDNGKFPLQLKSLQVGFNTGIAVGKIIDIVSGKGGDDKPRNTPPPANGDIISLRSIIDNFRISHNYVFNISKNEFNRDTFIVRTHGFTLQGNLPLTKNWSISVGNISYDFKSQRLIYPTFSFNRDLHCWRMTFGWYPESKTYNFFIGAKSSNLSFLKYNYGRNTFGSSPFI